MCKMKNVTKFLAEASELVSLACNEIKRTEKAEVPEILCQLEDAGDAISIAQLFLDDNEIEPIELEGSKDKVVITASEQVEVMRKI